LEEEKKLNRTLAIQRGKKMMKLKVSKKRKIGN